MNSLNIKHILVPIDFSPASLNAMDTAVAMAKRQGAKLTLLHVVNESFLAYHHEVLPITTIMPLIETMHEEAQSMLSQLTEQLVKEQGIEITGEIVQGAVSVEICKFAEKHTAEMIVMGTHGTSGFREFFLGSNAYVVIRHALCPVLTVPPTGKWTSFSKILFPVRDTPGPLDKYDFLRKIIRNNQNKTVLYVLGLPNPNRTTSESWVEERIFQLNSRLSDDAVECVTQLLQPTKRVAEEVLHTADVQKSELIAITATLDYGIRDFFVGPYTQQIVHHAKVPVLSIRPVQSLHQNFEQAMRSDYNPTLPNRWVPVARAAHSH